MKVRIIYKPISWEKEDQDFSVVIKNNTHKAINCLPVLAVQIYLLKE